jgi:RNA polymerase sigma factor (TIGR02999 family)
VPIKSDFTQLLARIESGDATLEDLLPVVYDELRRVASAKMAGERGDHTLGATALVHEAYLRLVGKEAKWESRRHFFAAAAESMRRILIDHARSNRAIKRGGEVARAVVDLEQLPGLHDRDDRFLQLDKAIEKLAEQHPEKAELVKLRYFTGLKIREAAEVLEISTASADRYWKYARAWLQTQLLKQD